MDLQLLGPIEATVDGRRIELGATKQRAVLAMLALRVNRSVSVDRLVEGVWGEHPPESAPKMVQHYISQLRKLLAGDGAAIVTHGRGYELQLAADSVDAERFEHLIAAAGHGGGNGAVREALALWRGDVLADVAGVPFASAEIRRLEELRLAAVELAIDRDLAMGRHREVVGELERLVLEEPLCEKLHLQRMLALYRSGRQADALEAYRQARTALVEQIGVEPGPDLRRLQEAILRQDPSLETPATELAEPAPELETSTPLLGRQAELDRLREHWRGARGGAGRLVLVDRATRDGQDAPGGRVGCRSAERWRRGGVCLGRSARLTWRSRQWRARDAGGGRRCWCSTTPIASARRWRPRWESSSTASAQCPCWSWRQARTIDRVAGLRSLATLSLAPLDVGAVRELAQFYCGSRRERRNPRRTARAGGRRGTAAAASCGARACARDDRPAPGGRRHPSRSRAPGAARGRGRSGGQHRRAAGGAGALGDRPARGRPCRGLPVQGAGLVRRRGRRVLLRPRAARRRAGRAAHRRAVDGHRRAVGERQVLRAAGGPARGARGRRAARQRALADRLAAARGAAAASARAGHRAGRVAGPAGRRRRPVRRALHGLSRRGRARGVRRRARRLCPRSAPPRARAGRRPGGLLRALRGISGAVAAAGRQPRAGRTDAPRRAAPRDRAARAPRRPAGRARARGRAARATSRAGRARCRCCRPRCSSCGSTATAGTCGLSAYEHAGGVHGAVARLAESAYERLDPEQRELARRILLRLAGEGEGEAVVRRRVPLDELEGEGVAEVLAVLAGDRLVTIGEGEVEVAHEALLREWPRLRGWLEEDAQGRQLQLHLRDAARAVGGRGARSGRALSRRAAGRGAGLVGRPRGRAQRGRARLRGREPRGEPSARSAGCARCWRASPRCSRWRSWRAPSRSSSAATPAARRPRPQAQRLGARALVEDDLDLSLLLARQGVALDDSPQTRGNLLAALLKSPAAIGVLRGDGDRLVALDLSPDERTLAFIDNDGTLSFVDLRTRRPAGPPATVPGHVGHHRPTVRLDHLQFSPDGSRLAVGGGEPVVLDARTRRVLARLRVGTDRFIYALRFSPDGRTLFAAVGLPPDGATPSSASTRAPASPSAAGRHGARRPRDADAHGDGRRVVTTGVDEDTVIHDARTLRPLQRWPVRAEQAALSPDDRTLLAGGGDGSVRFLDLVTGHGHARLRTPRRRRGAGGLQPRRATRRSPPREDGAHDRLGRRAGERRRDARGPCRADHRAGDHPRQRDAVHERPGQQGHHLGSRRRPPPRPPVHGRAGQPGGPALRPAP